jgi:anti-anti-sigma factor
MTGEPRIEYEVVERKGDHVLVRLRGELSGRVWTDRIGEALDEHFVDDGVKRIRLDISPVTFMDSYGIATLVALAKESRAKGKRLFIEGATGQAREKLVVSGLLTYFQEGR